MPLTTLSKETATPKNWIILSMKFSAGPRTRRMYKPDLGSFAIFLMSFYTHQESAGSLTPVWSRWIWGTLEVSLCIHHLAGTQCQRSSWWRHSRCSRHRREWPRWRRQGRQTAAGTSSSHRSTYPPYHNQLQEEEQTGPWGRRQGR